MQIARNLICFIGALGIILCANTIPAGEIHSCLLNDPYAGHWLAQTQDLRVWWCDSGWKVGLQSPSPNKSNGSLAPVAVSSAGGEYEPVQVILRPETDGELLSVLAGRLRGRTEQISSITVRINEVAYVHVTHPTDSTCKPGWYPDPLPPLHLPLKLAGGKNQPLWITFFVPRGTEPGDYHGNLKLTTSFGDVDVPMRVHVYDFALPEETHLKSAFGLNTGTINLYQHLTRQADKVAVYQKYLRDFAAHRISPYSFSDYTPIQIRFAGKGTNLHAQLDFTQFDRAAARWLDQYHFNTFRLDLPGMGGGTYYSRHLGELGGFEEGTPEYDRLFQDYLGQIEQHLRAHGWLSKAYTYWFDEPSPKDYKFVVAGMKRLKKAAPGIKRMLTEQPAPALLGNVDIWCGLTPRWTRKLVREREAAGDEVWWYICCSPKAPYVTEFIDHPGTELRLWPWQSWQYGVSGILIWSTTYWTSSAAYSPPRLQNPWKDPMSYISGYGQKPGEIGYWGNGDGRFLYPPCRDPNHATTLCLDGPIDSIRWENLRDGMDDYEYFWLLQQAVERVRAKQGETALVKTARRLLKVPDTISRDLTHFTDDPRLLDAHRDHVARIIERLQAAR